MDVSNSDIITNGGPTRRPATKLRNGAADAGIYCQQEKWHMVASFRLGKGPGQYVNLFITHYASMLKSGNEGYTRVWKDNL